MDHRDALCRYRFFFSIIPSPFFLFFIKREKIRLAIRVTGHNKKDISISTLSLPPRQMDSEKYATSVDLAESLGASTASSKGEKQQELHRGLKARHIQMIALGGTIGASLRGAIIFR